MPAVLVTGPTVMQNSPFLPWWWPEYQVASAHSVYIQRDGQAELTWVVLVDYKVKKVKFCHSLYRALGGDSRADPGVQAISPQVPAVGCHYFPPGLCLYLVSVHQMAPPSNEVVNI